MLAIKPIARSLGVDASQSFAAHFRHTLNDLSMEEDGVEVLSTFQFPRLFQPGFVVAFGYLDHRMVAVGLKPLNQDSLEVWTGQNGEKKFVCQITHLSKKSEDLKRDLITPVRTQFEKSRDLIMYVKTHVRDCKSYQPNILSHKTFHPTCRLDLSNFIQDCSIFSGNDLTMTIIRFLSIDDCFTFSNQIQKSTFVPIFNFFEALPAYPTNTVKLGLTKELSSAEDPPRLAKRRKIFHFDKGSLLRS